MFAVKVIHKCGVIAKSNSLVSKLVKADRQLSDKSGGFSSYAYLRFFSTTGVKSTNEKKLDQQRVHGSVLEEIMIKKDEKPKTTAQKVKKGAENTFLYVSLTVSVALLGGIVYILFETFFSKSSPQRIYSKALKEIRNDPNCQSILGDDIAGFGEQSKRSRRHIASHAYKVGDEERVRVTFHVKGSLRAGRVFVEVYKKPGESWSERFLFIELADRTNKIVLYDHRSDAIRDIAHMTITKTHNEIMCEDGFRLKRSRKRVIRPKMKLKLDNTVDFIVDEKQARVALENAHSIINDYLSDYMQNLLLTLRNIIQPNRSIGTIRAVGIGNFYQRFSDSCLQMAVLERIISEFGQSQSFYQEPRCVEAERLYLNSQNIKVIPADSFEEIPAEIASLMKTDKKALHLIYMIHFDHYGFENLLKSFERIGLLSSLIFIGNTIPCDYPSPDFHTKLCQFKEVSLNLPPKTLNGSASHRDKSKAWWRKAFANTSIYSHISLDTCR